MGLKAPRGDDVILVLVVVVACLRALTSACLVLAHLSYRHASFVYTGIVVVVPGAPGGSSIDMGMSPCPMADPPSPTHPTSTTLHARAHPGEQNAWPPYACRGTMDLVGGYGSSSSDDDEPKEKQQQQSTLKEPPKGKGKARAPAALPAQASTTAKQQQPPAEEASSSSKKKRKNRSSSSSGSKKKKATSTKKHKKNKSKTINALVLSPEIQAALARGETLGDSDSDDDAPDKKPPKIVRRPAGSDPNDLLSLLPQPSTASSADDILLKNQKKREDAKTSKSEAAETAAAAAAAATAAATTAPATTTTAPAPTGGGGGVGDQDEPEDQESDSDEDGDDLLAGMRAKSASAPAAPAAAGPDSAARSAPLFTLPSRARPPPGAVAADPSPSLEEEIGAVGVPPPAGDDTALATPGHAEPGVQQQQPWGGGIFNGHSGASPHGGYGGGAGYGGAVGAGAGAPYAAYGAAAGQQVWFWTFSDLAQLHTHVALYHVV